MKVDLTSAIVAAIVGVILAYLLTGNVLIKAPTPVTIKSIEGIGTDLSEPDPELFNYRSLNPTVEVYIDNTNYDVVDKNQDLNEIPDKTKTEDEEE